MLDQHQAQLFQIINQQYQLQSEIVFCYEMLTIFVYTAADKITKKTVSLKSDMKQ